MKETGKSLLMIGWISNFILYWSMFNGKWKYGIKSSKKSPISSALSTEKFFLQCTFSKAFITSVHSDFQAQSWEIKKMYQQFYLSAIWSGFATSKPCKACLHLFARKLFKRNVLQQNANFLWRKSVSALENHKRMTFRNTLSVPK